MKILFFSKKSFSQKIFFLIICVVQGCSDVYFYLYVFETPWLAFYDFYFYFFGDR